MIPSLAVRIPRFGPAPTDNSFDRKVFQGGLVAGSCYDVFVSLLTFANKRETDHPSAIPGICFDVVQPEANRAR